MGARPWRGALVVFAALAACGIAVPSALGAARDPSLTVIASPSDGSIAPMARPLIVRLKMKRGVTVREIALNGTVISVRPGPPRKGVRRLALRASHGLQGGENVLSIATRRGAGGATDFDQSVFWFASRDPSLLVLGAPRAGARMPSEQVTAAIRTRAPVQRMRAWLNGRSVTARFAAPSSQGVRRARLSAVQGLVQGRNVLRIEVVRGNRYLRIAHRFDLDGARPLASPGTDLASKAGQPVALDGGGSRPSTRSAAAARLTHAWTITRRPAGSSPRLTAPRTATPTLTTDLPGSYVLSHVVGDGAASSEPVSVTVSAFPEVVVPVNTLTTDAGGDNGVRVGSTFYPNPGTDGHQVQALRFDRDTLELLDQEGFPSSDGGLVSLLDFVQASVGDLLVLSVPPGGSLVGSPITAGTLTGIGKLVGSPIMTQRAQIGVRGPFSLIATPGSGANAQESTAPTGAGGGALVGNLVLDVNGNYAFAFPDHPAFDTQSPSGASAPNTISVGTTHFPAPAAAAGATGGFQVLTLNQFSLAPVGNATFATNGPDAVAQIDAMAATLRTSDADQLLTVVQSFGSPAPTVDTTPLATAWNALAVELEDLGGTRDVVLRLSGTQTYSLVARSPGDATEASSRITPAQPSARQQGFLSQDSESRWGPAIGTPANDLNYELLEIVYQEPEPWPLSTSPGDIAANAYIAQELDLVGTDVRANYLNENDDFGGNLTFRLQGLGYPGGQPGFTEAEFTALKSQLLDEFGWVDDVRTYISNVKSPFSSSSTQAYADLNAVAQQIVSSLNPPQKANVKQTVFQVVEEVVLGISRLDKSAQPLGAVAAIFGVAAALSTTPQGVPVGPVTSTAAQFGKDFVDALDVQVGAFEAIGDVIVSDYGKLQAVATKATGDPAWVWLPSTAGVEKNAILTGATQSFWGTLMPTAYTAWELPLSTCSPDDTGFECAPYTRASQLQCVTFLHPAFRPFSGEPGSGQIRLAQRLLTEATSLAPIGTPVAPILAWGAGAWNGKSKSGDPLQMPPSSLTNPLFETLGTPGGVGLYAPWFWTRNFSPKAVPSTTSVHTQCPNGIY